MNNTAPILSRIYSSTEAYPPIERLARAIAYAHFDRKKWIGYAPKAERNAWAVDMGWKTFIPDARIVAGIMGIELEEQSDAT